MAGGALAADGQQYFLYGPAGPIEQVDASSGTATYQHTDGLGSPRLLTDASGSVVGSYGYGAWGAPSHAGSASTPLGFTGGYTDGESGFVYLRARYYDPATAQFLSLDPVDASTRATATPATTRSAPPTRPVRTG